MCNSTGTWDGVCRRPLYVIIVVGDRLCGPIYDIPFIICSVRYPGDGITLGLFGWFFHDDTWYESGCYNRDGSESGLG